ncbi:MAG: hypothetical protein FWH17_02485 [Oscillospiraceae bacterium]|nr:hypothetical protein [Oscillospiraceae bacterium]
MSGAPEQTQDIYAIRKTPADRARIQKKLNGQMEIMYGESAVTSDMAAFFGGRPDDDFLPEKCCGLKCLDSGISRLDSVRLYMIVFGGYTPEEVMSRSPEMRAHKQKFGKDFCDIITSGDPVKTGEMWREMTLHLNSYKLPDINFFDDESMVDNYREAKFYSGNARAHFNAMNGANDILHRHRWDELSENEKNSMGAQVVLTMFDETMSHIEHESYLTNRADNDTGRAIDDTERRNAYYANTAIRAKHGRELRMLRGGNFSQIADRNTGSMAGGKFGSGAGYQQIFDDLMDIEEISSAEMRYTPLIDNRRPERKAAKDEISLAALSKEAAAIASRRGAAEAQTDIEEALAARQKIRDEIDYELQEKYAEFGRDIEKKDPITPQRYEPGPRKGFARFFRNRKKENKPEIEKVPLEYGSQAEAFAQSGSAGSRAALEAYVDSTYEDINNYLRDRPMKVVLEGYIDAIADKAADIKDMYERKEAKLDKGHVLFRWTHFPGELEDLGDQMEGKVITDKAFVSTSLHRKDGFYRSNSMLMKIYAKSGTPAVLVEGNIGKEGRSEEEILLPPDAKLRIIGYERFSSVIKGRMVHNIPYVKVEALGPNDPVKDEDVIVPAQQNLSHQNTPEWQAHLTKKEVLQDFPPMRFKTLNKILESEYKPQADAVKEGIANKQYSAAAVASAGNLSRIDMVIRLADISPADMKSKVDSFLKEKAALALQQEKSGLKELADKTREEFFPGDELKNRYFGEPVKTNIKHTELNPQANKTVGNTQTPAAHSKQNDTPKLDNPPPVKKTK